MAVTLFYRHNNASRDGFESDETDKPLSATGSTDCNQNPTGFNGEKIKLHEAKEVRQSISCATEVDKGEDREAAKNGNNNKESYVCGRGPPRLTGEVEPISEKASELTCGDASSSNQNVAQVSPELEESSSSACQADTTTQGISNDGKSHYDQISSEDSSAENNNNKQSYLEIKSKRKTLIKIEKLTDSDNRSRDKMRRRALSPPSSSDEENLYIGWIAYPASITSFRRTSRKPRRDVWMKAVKFVFYPVTKVCQKCIRNKVGDVDVDK